MDRHVLGASSLLFASSLLMQHGCASAYNVLMIPIPGRSHLFSMAAVAEALVSRGHRVSLLVGEHFPADNLPELGTNGSGITLERFFDTRNDGLPTDYENMFENITVAAITKDLDEWKLLPIVRDSRDQFCENLVSRNNELLKKLESQKFDLAVVDGIFIMKCIYLVPHRLRIPWATYCDIADPLIMKAPWLPSFVPHSGLSLTDRMTFVERLKNTFLSLLFLVYSPFPDPPSSVLDAYRRYGWFRDLDDLMSRSQLWLLTKDIVLDYSRPMMSNMINVGGLTVKRTNGDLPRDLRQFIDGAQRGVILVTFGSTTSRLPSILIQKFVSAFRRLEGYRVIWRLNNGAKETIPDDILISSWLPQNDILAHPATKLFITHSGNNGQFEAVYHGVPMIGFPVSAVGDQAQNARLLDHKGYGVSMDVSEFTADELLENIRKILGDKSYKQRIMKASEIFRSQPQTPVERATYWIEHVCRFGGDHLRSGGNDLPLYSYFMIDIIALVLGPVLVILYLITKLAVAFVIRNCRSRGSAPTKIKKTD